MPDILHPDVLSPDDPRSCVLSLARQKLIVALDVPDSAQAFSLLDRLDGTCHWLKVGLELFLTAGPSIVTELRERGHSVFLDLKLHDIPNTVAAAVRSASSLGAELLTIHAAGGPAMLEAAREAALSQAHPPQLLAVTLLTSMDVAQLKAIEVPHAPELQVELLAQMSLKAGIYGFVSSAQEVRRLRSLTGPRGILVTPGIRPAHAETNDQKRTATPAQALREGSSYLVIGRPITQAADPAAAARTILAEMGQSLQPLQRSPEED